MKELKPCPFCGEIPTMTHDIPDCETYVIQCVNGECGCMPVTWGVSYEGRSYRGMEQKGW